MKNKFLTFIIAVVVLLPAIIACTNYILMKDRPVSEVSVTEGSLVIPENGGESEPMSIKSTDAKLDLNNIDSNLLKYFTDVITESKKVSGLPDSVMGEAYYTLTLTNYNRPVEYRFYYTERADHCYFIDDDSVCYLIPEDYAKAFLVSRYAMGIFDASVIPTLTTLSGEKILSDSLVWTYRTVDEYTYSQLKETVENANEDKVYTIAQKLNLAFDIIPGSATVDISLDGEKIYSGLFDDASYADIPGNRALDVSLTAKWYETEDRKSEGEITYKFKCKITDAPIFQVTSNEEGGKVNAGDFICVTAKNVIGDASTITFTSSPSLGVTPVFYQDDIYCRALIPVDPETEEGTYTLTFTADGSEQSIEVEISKNPYARDLVAESIASDKLNEESVAEFEKNMKSTLKDSSDTKYFEGEFIYPLEGANNIKSGYGRRFVTEGGYEYLNDWVRLEASTGTTVTAMNSGTVVYTGEQTLSGRTVVVDHGFGLMTIYANLSSVDVEVGDSVSRGDALGSTGNTGYTDGTRFAFAMTVNGKFVCPYQILDENGVIFAE